jgi:hypothetical protein
MSAPMNLRLVPELKSFAPSVVRTVVPLLVGYFSAWPIAGALGLQDDQITSVVTVVVTGLYYLLVRLAETYVMPQLGWLLLWASPPVYVDPVDVRADTTAAEDVVRVVRRAA